jgi:hypothetical protein
MAMAIGFQLLDEGIDAITDFRPGKPIELPG